MNAVHPYTHPLIMRDKQKAQIALRDAIAAIPEEERSTAIAAVLNELAERKRREGLMDQVRDLTTDELERLLVARSAT